MSSLQFTIISVEYTGNSPKKDAIIALAMVKIKGDEVIDSFESLIYPPIDVSEFTLAATHIKKTEIEEAPPFVDIAQEIDIFTKNTILVGLQVRRTYALLRKAFKDEELYFQRKHLCVSRLIEQNFTLHKVKTFTNVCRAYRIPFNLYGGILERAKAVTQVFINLFINKWTNEKLSKRLVNEEIRASRYPINLARQKVDDLPNAIGVYYFYNYKGQIIYLGKSVDIKKRVLQHFNSDLESSTKQKMKREIYDIQYKLTNSELLALLLESDEIKRFMPTYNKAQRRRNYKFGIYAIPDINGCLHLYVDYLGKYKMAPFIKFTSKWKAYRFLINAAFFYQLPLDTCGLAESIKSWLPYSQFTEEDFEQYADLLENEEDTFNIETHNNKVKKLIDFYSYPHPSMLLLDKGTHKDTTPMVVIRDYTYLGYAYLPTTMLNDDKTLPSMEEIKKILIPFRENPDVQRIILAYIRKYNDEVQIIPYEKH